MRDMKKWPGIVAVLIGVLTFHGQAQQPGKYLEFSLEELSAVDVVKPLMPVEVDSAYVVSGTTINLGFLLPIAGYPDYTTELINAARLAVDEINSSGGIRGKELALIPADIGGAEEFVIPRTTHLMENFHTNLFIGPTSSDAMINLAEQLLPQKNFSVVSITATSPAISTLDDQGNFFRTCPSDAIQGVQTAAFCRDQLKAKTAAVLYHDNFYGRNLRQVFSDEFTRLGGKIVGSVKVNPLINLEDYDMSDKLDSLLSGKPEVVYVISLAKNFSEISHQLAKKDLIQGKHKPVIVSSDGARGEDLVQTGNLSVLEGMYGYYLPFTGNKVFAEKYEKKYNKKPSALAAEYSYDIVYLMALAILKGNSAKPQEVATHLYSVSAGGTVVYPASFREAARLIDLGVDIDYKGISGDLDFDAYGDVNERKFALWQMVNGRVKYLDQQLRP